MIFDQQYEDLVTLLKNNVVSEIVTKRDVMTALTNIYQQLDDFKKKKQFGAGMDQDDGLNEK